MSSLIEIRFNPNLKSSYRWDTKLKSSHRWDPKLKSSQNKILQDLRMKKLGLMIKII